MEHINDLILKAFEKDVDEHFSVSNEGQKCSRCKFITHSMGILRMHEKKSHKVFNNFEKIVDGFKFDNKKYVEVLSAMYNGKELYKHECENCDFKTHCTGLQKLTKLTLMKKSTLKKEPLIKGGPCDPWLLV